MPGLAPFISLLLELIMPPSLFQQICSHSMHMAKMNTVLLLLFCCTFAVTAADNITADDLYNFASSLEMFVDEVPQMPEIKGYTVENGSVKPAKLQIGMFEKTWTFHRDIPNTTVFAFGTSNDTATVPGPTIEVMQSVDTYVTWENHLPSKHILSYDPSLTIADPKNGGIPAVVHLHGGIHEPESDGHPFAWFTPGFNETGPGWKKSQYHYNNMQHPGTLWYHDHALGLTRVNLLTGLLGGYVIRNSTVEEPLNLPSGADYDRVLFIFDRSFLPNGSIYLNSTGNNPSVHPQWQPSYFGETIIVNGKVWPYMKVQRRKYRFRIVNSSNARFYNLTLSNGLNVTFIGSDATYLPKPVTVENFVIAPSEIADVVIDFNLSSTAEANLTNSAKYPFPNGTAVDDLNSKVMKFVIESAVSPDPSTIPEKLVTYITPNDTPVAEERYITFFEYFSESDGTLTLLVNNVSVDTPATETPRQGTAELWHIINLTDENHPLHIHLANFMALKQVELINVTDFKECMEEKNDAVECNITTYATGNTTAIAGPDSGWKNVYKVLERSMTTIHVQFTFLDSSSPYPFNASDEPGYVYHCHVLEHEDNEMMRLLKILP